MSYKRIILLLPFLLLFLFQAPAKAEVLEPGFNKQEYIELIRAYTGWRDNFYRGIEPTDRYESVYRSPEMGLENKWELLRHTEKAVAVISIRGTTQSSNSWLENFYAAMVPAKGALQLTKDYTFDYTLSEDPKAAVHVGWLVATGFLAQDMLPQIDSAYKAGTKDFIIFGHSQGGAISYLLTSHLNHLKKTGRLPQDLRLKTYCSAAPKPGNLYYAYDYESTTAGGWAFNVVNTADWVPETPVSIQTMSDFNNVNPFTNADSQLKKQKLPQRLALKYVFNQLTKHTNKAQKRYEQYLGKQASKFARKQLKEFEEPDYYSSSNYVRTGNFIILKADESYYEKYPDNEERVFSHHMLHPYLYLAEKLAE